MNTPHGCAEQTISAGYANLLAWSVRESYRRRYSQDRGTPRAQTCSSQSRAWRAPGTRGARVTYWGTGDPDIAVTAYAVSFLVEASAVVPVDRDDIAAMITWLDNQQGPDGQWRTRYRDKEPAGTQEQTIADRSGCAVARVGEKSGHACEQQPHGTSVSLHRPIHRPDRRAVSAEPVYSCILGLGR